MNPGPGTDLGENNFVISVSMLRTILFSKHFLIGHEVAVCHIQGSLRIHVDGCNNFFILSNRVCFHFSTSFLVYPFSL
jgi:hypothetical protein